MESSVYHGRAGRAVRENRRDVVSRRPAATRTALREGSAIADGGIGDRFVGRGRSMSFSLPVPWRRTNDGDTRRIVATSRRMLGGRDACCLLAVRNAPLFRAAALQGISDGVEDGFWAAKTVSQAQAQAQNARMASSPTRERQVLIHGGRDWGGFLVGGSGG